MKMVAVKTVAQNFHFTIVSSRLENDVSKGGFDSFRKFV